MALSAEAMKRELHQHSKRLRGLFSFAVQPSLIALLLVLLIWMVCFTTIQILEDTKRLDAEQDVANVARVFEEHVARASRETDRTLLFLRTTYESDPSKFNLGKWVQDPEFKSELLVQFALIDPQGMMVESNVGSLDNARSVTPGGPPAVRAATTGPSVSRASVYGLPSTVPSSSVL